MSVRVYSTKTCPYCVKVKQWLNAHAIEFDDIYIDNDPEAMQRMIELTGQMSVPVTTLEAGGEVQYVLGFDEARLEQLTRW